MLIIERATEENLPAVLGVDAAHIGDSRAGDLIAAVTARQCYIAREGWDVLGFAILTRHFFGSPFIDLIVVHPDHQRKGVASALIQHITAVCPGEKLFTSTNQSNTPMRALCEGFGFVKSGWIDNLDPGDPELICFKALGKN